MANKCYNTFTFFGNAKVDKQVDAWYSNLHQVALTKSNVQSENIIFDVFYPGEVVQSAIQYLGSKWAYPDFGESISLDTGELGFVSAWCGMDGFQDHLTEVLSKLDKNVVVLLSTNTEAFEEAARYTAMGSDGKVVAQAAQLTYSKDDEEKEDPKYTLFYEHMRDSCDELIEELPSIKPRLKAHLKSLDDAFDESLKR